MKNNHILIFFAGFLSACVALLIVDRVTPIIFFAAGAAAAAAVFAVIVKGGKAPRERRPVITAGVLEERPSGAPLQTATVLPVSLTLSRQIPPPELSHVDAARREELASALRNFGAPKRKASAAAARAIANEPGKPFELQFRVALREVETA